MAFETAGRFFCTWRVRPHLCDLAVPLRPLRLSIDFCLQMDKTFKPQETQRNPEQANCGLSTPEGRRLRGRPVVENRVYKEAMKSREIRRPR